jgi:hypothetical protein
MRPHVIRSCDYLSAHEARVSVHEVRLFLRSIILVHYISRAYDINNSRFVASITNTQ